MSSIIVLCSYKCIHGCFEFIFLNYSFLIFAFSFEKEKILHCHSLGIRAAFLWVCVDGTYCTNIGLNRNGLNNLLLLLKADRNPVLPHRFFFIQRDQMYVRLEKVLPGEQGTCSSKVVQFAPSVLYDCELWLLLGILFLKQFLILTFLLLAFAKSSKPAWITCYFCNLDLLSSFPPPIFLFQQWFLNLWGWCLWVTASGTFRKYLSIV